MAAVNREAIRSWVAALRSGDYTQGKERLHGADGAWFAVAMRHSARSDYDRPDAWLVSVFGGLLGGVGTFGLIIFLLQLPAFALGSVGLVATLIAIYRLAYADDALAWPRAAFGGFRQWRLGLVDARLALKQKELSDLELRIRNASQTDPYYAQSLREITREFPD